MSEFAVVCIAALALLGVVAAVASFLQGGDDTVATGHDCSSCASNDGTCKIASLMEEKRQRDAELCHAKGNKTEDS